jgi:hypothetical protein
MSRRIRSAVLGACAAAFLVATSGPALAATTKEVIVDAGLFALPDINCHGFKLTEETLSEQVTIWTTTDDEGNVVEVKIKVNFFGVLTNSKTGEEFRDHVAFTQTEDLVDGTFTISGSTFHFVESGEGLLYAEGGTKVIVAEDGTVTFDAGPNDFTTSGLDGICEALG